MIPTFTKLLFHDKHSHSIKVQFKIMYIIIKKVHQILISDGLYKTLFYKLIFKT